MISQKAKYAMRALVALARGKAGEPMQIADIAQSQHIPRKFLEQILVELKNHGLVTSRRGKQGGYLLLRPADEITYGDVLRMVDGPMAPLPCLSVTAYRKCDDCPDEGVCEVRQAFAPVAERTRAILFSTTIADSMNAASTVGGEDFPAWKGSLVN